MPNNRRDTLAQELQTRCRGHLKRDEPLSAHTTFGVGGPADLFFSPADLEDLALAIPLIHDADFPALPLGGGTNILVRDAGFRGVIISLTDGLQQVEITRDQGIVQAGASTQVFSRRCQRAGQTGFEFGCGIPGTIGGAIRGNAGAWGGETLGRLHYLRGIDLTTGTDIELKQADITYGYRHADLSDDLVIVEAGFQLEEDDPDAIQARMDQMLSERKASQPLWNRSSGCMFKNPPETSAGFLIDQAGCKKMSVGKVEVSDLHANFMVNLGGQSAEDALTLMRQVQQRVKHVHGIDLEPEIRIIGENGLETP